VILKFEIETVYNMYRMRRFTPITVCAGCCLWALPTMPYRKLTSQGQTVNHRNPTSPGAFGVLLPPGECAMQGDVGVQLGSCVGAVCGGVARGRAGFDAVYK
jgi:hypothetical protein